MDSTGVASGALVDHLELRASSFVVRRLYSVCLRLPRSSRLRTDHPPQPGAPPPAARSGRRLRDPGAQVVAAIASSTESASTRLRPASYREGDRTALPSQLDPSTLQSYRPQSETTALQRRPLLREASSHTPDLRRWSFPGL